MKTLIAHSAIAAAMGIMAAGSTLAIPAAAQAQAPAVANNTVAPPLTALDAQFRAIADEEWAWRSQEMPSRGSARFPDVSAEGQARRLTYWLNVQQRLDAISLNDLSPQERTNYSVYKHQIDSFVEDIQFGLYEMPFTADSSFWSGVSGMANSTFGSVADYERYLDRLRAAPAHFDQQIVNMRAGIARGFVQPREALSGRDISISTISEATNPVENQLYGPFKFMSGISEAEQQRLRAEAVQVIGQIAVPAFQNLLTFYRGEYLPATRTTLGADKLPNGEAFYQSQIRQYTSIDMTPDEIHQIGLSEVARLRAEMETVMRSTGWTGTFNEFTRFLKTDKQFTYDEPEHLLWHAAWVVKKVDGKMAQYFELQPRQTFDVSEIPANIAPFYTAGRGNCSFNTYDLPSRPRYNIPALTVHECNPGHAWHGKMRSELPALPAWRLGANISAFGEGWGLYTEKLGVEMGVYENAYEDFGRLNYEMWRAARLVIDTGLHSKGWSRDQALAYLTNNTALSDHEIRTEIDRYITWPGQALAYKLGQIEIIRLRAKAEAELGSDFDIRKFHDKLIGLIVATIPAMTAEMEAFITEQKANTAP